MSLLDALRCMFELQMMCHLTESGEDGGGGHRLVQMEWRPSGWSVCLPLLIFLCTIKSRSSLLALAHPGDPGKRAVKWLWCVVKHLSDRQLLFLWRHWTCNLLTCKPQGGYVWVFGRYADVTACWEGELKWFEAREICWLVVTVCRQLQKLGHLLRVGGSSATEMHGQVMQLVARAAIKVVHCCCWLLLFSNIALWCDYTVHICRGIGDPTLALRYLLPPVKLYRGHVVLQSVCSYELHKTTHYRWDFMSIWAAKKFKSFICTLCSYYVQERKKLTHNFILLIFFTWRDTVILCVFWCYCVCFICFCYSSLK